MMHHQPERRVQIVCGEESEECMSGVHVCYAPGVLRQLEPDLVSRCGLLRDLSGIYGTAELPFTPEEFSVWHDFQGAGGRDLALPQACVLVKVRWSVVQQCSTTNKAQTLVNVTYAQVAGFLQDSMNARWVKLVGNLLNSLCSSHGRHQHSFKVWLETIQNFQQSLPEELLLLVSPHLSVGYPIELIWHTQVETLEGLNLSINKFLVHLPA